MLQFIQIIWYLVLISLGTSVTLMALLHMRYLMLDRRKNKGRIHISQADLTDFLHECIEDLGEDDPVWCARNRKEDSRRFPYN